MASEGFDLALNPEHDCRTESGVFMWICLLLRLDRGAIVPLGSPCKFFIWATKSLHRRSKEQPQGDRTNDFTLQGDVIAHFVADSLLLIAFMGAYYFSEQPVSSSLYFEEEVHAAVLATEGKEVRWSMGNFAMGNFANWLRVSWLLVAPRPPLLWCPKR